MFTFRYTGDVPFFVEIHNKNTATSPTKSQKQNQNKKRRHQYSRDFLTTKTTSNSREDNDMSHLLVSYFKFQSLHRLASDFITVKKKNK
jgi:hypothetical protein